MVLAAAVAPQIPFLRRYARALMGSQREGDAAVAAMLEALVADPSLFERDRDPRCAVYRLFTQLRSDRGPGSDPDAGDVVAQRLEAITPRPRQAFLLTAVEGFSPADAAHILDIDEAELDDLVAEAGRQIGKEIATRVLIIEDEPIIALELEHLVTALGHTVIGNARTHAEAIRFVEVERPGLVLADIRLADGSSGLDAVNEILDATSVPVVFITAYPEFLLTGSRPEPTFLITKPFSDEMVRAVISQALFFRTRPSAPAASPASQ